VVIGVDASRAVSDQPTGTESYTYHLIKALIPVVDKRGHSLRLYFNQDPPEKLLPPSDSFEIIKIPFPRLWTHMRLANEISRRPPDIFFTPAHVIPFNYRRPSVATVHDLGYHFFPETHTRRQTRYLEWSTQHNARQSQRVITDSFATKLDLVRVYDIDKSKIDVIYPGLDPTIHEITDRSKLSEVQRRYGISPPYLLYIGTLQPRKNIERLIEAFIESGVDQQLVIAGKAGWLAQPILDTAFGYQSTVTNNLVLTGFVAHEDKSALISGADALLYPSLYEGFGFPILEGNACGTPVICANSSSLPEIAHDAALLINPLDVEDIAQAIKKLLREPKLRSQLVSSGHANARRFSWEICATQVLDTLERAV
jgi:glycosyltransferase involved in cell wall biosynthesis